ncbi:MAG: peptidoglycan glycosyltransferase [Verrucomicrobia bacterium TMED44]|nr:MAG: peptidoglycan glycosyltransferase [Verrucomicrobia bacterium TMED44]
MRSLFVSKFRYYIVFSSVCFGFCSLGGRLIWLQVVESERFTSVAKVARKNFVSVKARRGDIVDSKGNLLATTRSVVEVGLDPQSLVEDDRLKWKTLADYLGIQVKEIEVAAAKKTRSLGMESEGIRDIRWVKLKEEVDEGTYRKIQELRIKGVYGNFKHSRLYPNRNLASHILGFVNKEDVAAMGVERFADYYLKGQDGWRESEKDGRRREMPQHRSLEVGANDGLNVELSLDRRIQDIVEEELLYVVEEFEPLSASIIVSDPKSGYILALANAPDFDPNEFNTAELAHQRNRALSDLYEPGSTFKIVAVGGAMNEGLVTEHNIIDCTQSTIRRGNRNLRLPSDHHPLGKISVSKVVQKSSNRGAARLGILLGTTRLYEYCLAFGFGQKTNFGIGGERKGILHAPERWDGLTITRLPIGHAVSVTPMQVHAAMSAVANEGVLMKPQFISRVFDNTGKTIVPFDPKPVRKVISSSVSRKLSQMLVSVVSNEGTARRAVIEGFSVAGKTGTTQKIIEGKYSNRHHVASFVGYFPANDPRVVITVVVDEPKMKKGFLGYGGVVAAPSFQRVGEGIISYWGLKPESKDNEVASRTRFKAQAL